MNDQSLNHIVSPACLVPPSVPVQAGAACASSTADAGKATASSSGREWIPELDGLRVIMIFVVSWFHFWQQSWLCPYVGKTSLDFLVRSGYVWVDGTVLLSAFLLFLPWARVWFYGGRLPDTGAFYFRRARRILPAYWFSLLLHLLVIAIPYGQYSSPQFFVKDLFTHLTCIFPFFQDTYMQSNLGGTCWTLAIEVQAYVLFPWIARAILKKPALTLSLITALTLGFRAWCIWALTDYAMVVNQLANFGDVYTLGILLAMAYVRVKDGMQTKQARAAHPKRFSLLCSFCATLLFALSVFCLVKMLKLQAHQGVYASLQGYQMMYRPLFALCFGGLLISCPFLLRPLRFLLGNRVMHFLSGISMNYYLTHQSIAVHLKRLGIPYSEYELPNQNGDRVWQYQYTFLCFGISLAVAILLTYLVEKPAARFLEARYRRHKGRQQREG